MNTQRHPGTTRLVTYCLDRRLLDEGQARHIDGCDLCQAAVRGLRQEQEAFDLLSPADQRLQVLLARLEQERHGRARRRWLLIPAGATLTIIAVLGLLFATRGADTRLKGGRGVQVYVQRDGGSQVAAEGFTYRPGDRIRLGVRSPTAARVTVETLQNDRFRELPELVNLPIQGGEERILPGSLRLDCSGAAETLRLRFTSPLGPNRGEDQVTLVLGCAR